MPGCNIEIYWRKLKEATDLCIQLSQLFGVYSKREGPEFLLRKLETTINNLEFIKEFLQSNLPKKEE